MKILILATRKGEPFNFEFEANEQTKLGDLQKAFEYKLSIPRYFYTFTLHGKASYTNDDPERNLFEFLKSYGINTNQNEITIGYQDRKGPNLSPSVRHVKVGSHTTPYSTVTPDSLCKITAEKIKEYIAKNVIKPNQVAEKFYKQGIITKFGLLPKSPNERKPHPADTLELFRPY